MPAGHKVLLIFNFECSLFDTEESTEIHADDGGQTIAIDEDDLMKLMLIQDDVY